MATLIIAAVSAALSSCGRVSEKSIHAEVNNVIMEMKPVIISGYPNADQQRAQWKADAEKCLTMSVGSDIQKFRGDESDAQDHVFIAKSEQIMSDWRVAQSDVSVFLWQNQEREGKLTGTRLKLLARLVEGDLEIAAQMLKTPRREIFSNFK